MGLLLLLLIFNWSLVSTGIHLSGADNAAAVDDAEAEKGKAQAADTSIDAEIVGCSPADQSLAEYHACLEEKKRIAHVALQVAMVTHSRANEALTLARTEALRCQKAAFDADVAAVDVAEGISDLSVSGMVEVKTEMVAKGEDMIDGASEETKPKK